MKLTGAAHFEKRKKADLLVLPFWQHEKQASPAFSLSLLESGKKAIQALLETGDFKGKEGEVAVLYLDKQPEKRCVLLGLGKEKLLHIEGLRRSYGTLAKTCLGKKWLSLNVVVPEKTQLSESELGRGMSEGLLLANYHIPSLKHSQPDQDGNENKLIHSIHWVGASSKAITQESEKAFKLCQAVYYVRDLVNGNADEVTPPYLAQQVKELGRQYPEIKVTVFDKKRIEKEHLDLLLAVNRGSSLDPAFLILEYRGNPQSKDHTVIVGKGITYDTGGLNIKSSGMETMKCDMAGAATAIGIILAARHLKLKVNVTAVAPVTENCTDANSFKPGDVYKSHHGKTVEMTNSDAEGRLILADALSYASKKLKPTRIIDMATLTGAIDIALGSEAAGMLSSDEMLAAALIQAGQTTFERVWRMPLYDEYLERLKSDIADLKSWNGRSAGSCVAAIFLREFVDPSISWAHLDIASTAYGTDNKKYLPKYATGMGVRLIIELLEHLPKAKAKS